MKKSFTFKLVFFALFVYGALNVSAQIEGLDPSKYYQIINHNSKNAIGIDNQNLLLEGALIQQQAASQAQQDQLWHIAPLTDTTYLFINKGTGMALGLSNWRGVNPFWTGPASPTSEEKDAALMVPSFQWEGWHRGVVQRTLNETDETQIWRPSRFPTNSTSGDTVFYRMTLHMNLADSGFSFNIWERRILVGYRNICLFPGERSEKSLYDDATSLYAYYFVKTNEDVISSVRDNINDNNFTVYSSDGYIIVRGDIRNKAVEVYSILGTRVYSTLANSSELNIAIKQGLYFVKAGNRITKLVVE